MTKRSETMSKANSMSKKNLTSIINSLIEPTSVEAMREVAEGRQQLRASSLDVAAYFGKRHDHVLRDIDNLQCSQGFRLPNFGESSYINTQGRVQRAVTMTKDGFMLLTMGYTGQTAMSIKEQYINAFNKLHVYYVKQWTKAKEAEMRNYARERSALIKAQDYMEKGVPKETLSYLKGGQ